MIIAFNPWLVIYKGAIEHRGSKINAYWADLDLSLFLGQSPGYLIFRLEFIFFYEM